MFGSRKDDLLWTSLAGGIGIGECKVPKLRIIQTKWTSRVTMRFKVELMMASCKYDIE